jgi:EAL domain-containing protein (putative c-di-GMP-specific phosphodiesterase class I)
MSAARTRTDDRGDMGVWSYAASGRRRRPEAAAWPLGGLGAALAAAGIVHAAVAGPGGGAVEDARHMGVFVLGAALVLLRATTVRAGRDVWLALGIGATLDALAQGLWTFAYGGSLRASPADAVFGVAYLVGCVGLSLYLRRRVGHALRTFSFDAIGITVYASAVGAAFLLRPIMNTMHVSQLSAAVCVFYPAAALIRWCHPTRGEVSPAELLPVARRGGLMSELTDWVLDRAIAEAARLRDEGHPLRVSVNVSAVTLVDVGLPDRIAGALRRHDVPAERLTVEVTEDAVMRDHRRCREVLAAIAALGVEIAIDDFGTGQSSLGQLRTLPADELKIDRRFVSGMAADPLDAEIVRMVIGLGRRMGLRVVAEGIESDVERDLLRELGCDCLQGFGIGRPMAAGALRDWLAAAGTPVTS